MTERILIAGAGHAAGQFVASLKQHRFDGTIVVVGDEPHLPYQRPPLSKKYLSGDLLAERLSFKPPGFYDEDNIELRLGTSIDGIDRRQKTVSAGDDTIDYDKLVLATGSRVRKLDVDGADLDGIHYLRNIADVDGIRAEFEHAKRAVIVGAGYIGLEVAAVLRQHGLDVTVIEMADRVMSRVVSPEISDFYQIEHANHGVKLRLSTGLTAFHGKRRIQAVETTEGENISADFVVVGVGVIPNTELAAEAGLRADNGIVVDDRCRTEDPNVFAIGDCTSHPNAIYDRRIRLESVHNALEQAKTAAANLAGVESHYAQVPWFWSDQYDLKLQIAGLSEGYDRVVIRGNPTDRAFACLYLRNNRLIATDAINSPRDFMQSKPLIADGVLVDDYDRLADASIPLKALQE